MCLLHPQEEAVSQPRKPVRSKLWELNSKLLCPVIGTCMTTRELRAFAKRCGIREANNWSDYRLHVSFVNAGEERNKVTKLLHKFLDKKFAAKIRAYAQLVTSKALLNRWRQDVLKGDIAASFWAAATHAHADFSVQTEIYETVHMISHQQGAMIRSELRHTHELEAQLGQVWQEIQARTERYFKDVQQRDARIDEAEKKIEHLGQNNALLRKRNSELEALINQQVPAPSTAKLQQRIDWLQQRDDEKSALIVDLEQRFESMLVYTDKLQRENEALQALFPDSSPDQAQSDKGAAVMNQARLAGTKILCVGGRSAQEQRYREVIDRCDGCLLVHDGGQEQSLKQLDGLLAQADAVICPTDCVSHNAYYRTKNYCKRTGKPCVFLESSSNSAFATGVMELSGKLQGSASTSCLGGCSAWVYSACFRFFRLLVQSVIGLGN